MRILQRVTSALGWATLAATGTMIVLEATGATGAGWRRPISDFLSWLVEPSAPRWQVTLAGAGLAALAAFVLAAQLVPGRRSIAPLRIDTTEGGSTIVGAPAIYSRIRHEIEQIDGVHTVTPRAHPKRLEFGVELVDTADASVTAAAIRRAITPEVWASLGMAPRRVDCTLTYRRSSTPVTRKEQLV